MKMKQKMMEKGVENEPKMPTVNNPIAFSLCNDQLSQRLQKSTTSLQNNADESNLNDFGGISQNVQWPKIVRNVLM